MKFSWSDIVGFVGWSLLIFLIFYVLLRIFGLVKSLYLEFCSLNAHRQFTIKIARLEYMEDLKKLKKSLKDWSILC